MEIMRLVNLPFPIVAQLSKESTEKAIIIEAIEDNNAVSYLKTGPTSDVFEVT